MRKFVLLVAMLALVATAAMGITGLRPAAAVAAKYPAPAGGNGGRTAPGVTATSVKVGGLYDITGPDPGAELGVGYGAHAYANYVNSLGGVYGRTIRVNMFDAAFDPTKAKADCDQMISGGYFAMAGGWSPVDSGCFPDVQKSGIPFIEEYLDPQFASLASWYAPGQGLPTRLNTAPYVEIKHLFPKVKKVAELYEVLPGMQAATVHIAPGLKASGFDVVLTEGLQDSATSFANYVVQMRNAGVQGIFMDASTIGTIARLAQAMAAQGFHPSFAEAAESYEAQWHSVASPGAAGWLASPTVAYLNPAALRATPGGKLLQTWFEKTNPGKQIDLFTIFGWEEMALFTQAMVDAGPHLTRADLLSSVHAIHSFSAQGLIANSDVGDHALATCTLVVASTSTGYTQLAPKGEPGKFACNVPGASVINSTP